MATVLGTVYLNGCNYQLAYDLLSQNIANNTSTVRFYGILNVTNNYISWTRGTASVHTASQAIGTYYGKGSHTLITADFTFGHNSDGNFSAWIGASLSTTFVSGSTGGTLTLPRILRYPVISSADNFNDEGNPTVKYTSYNTFPIRVRMEVTGNSSIVSRNMSANSSSCTFNLTDEERNKLRSACTNSNSLAVRFVVSALNGNTELSWSYLDRTMTIVNGNPTFSNFTYKDANETVTTVTGNNQVLVKGMSNLQLTISSDNKMVANKKATAKNYIATIDSINQSIDYDDEDLVITMGTLTSSGSKRLDVRAYDSRNNSTLVSKDITVYDYDKPVINATVTRLNNFENQTTLKVSGTYSKLTIDGTDKNVVATLQYRYKEEYGEWSNWTDLTSTISDGQFSCEDVIMSCDNTKSFNFEVQAIDNLQTTVLPLTLDIGQAIFFISTNKKSCYINGQEILTYDVLEEF